LRIKRFAKSFYKSSDYADGQYNLQPETMSIISKYLTREIFRYVIIVLTTVVGIYIAVDFFEKIDNFMEAAVPLPKIIIFFLFKIPFIIAQILPVCLLLAVLIVFGLMARNNEILALRSSGVSIWQLLNPLIYLGFMFSFLLFLLSEVIVPLTVGESNQIWLREVKKKSAVVSRENNIWLKDNRRITHIKYYDRTLKAIFGVTVYYFDDDFRLARRTDAKRGVFKDGKWSLYEVLEQSFVSKEEGYRVVFHKEIAEMLDLMPENLTIIVKKSEEMSFKELLAYVKRVEDEGYDATLYRVDLQAKGAFPFICLILCIIGAGIAVKGKIKESLPTGIAYGIAIAFFYWVLYSFCLSLGYGEILSPGIAAWTANFVFLCFGIFNLLNAE